MVWTAVAAYPNIKKWTYTYQISCRCTYICLLLCCCCFFPSLYTNSLLLCSFNKTLYRYPSGNLAVSLSRCDMDGPLGSHKGLYTLIFDDCCEGSPLLGYFTPLGKACCYHKNGVIKMFSDSKGGCLYNEVNDKSSCNSSFDAFLLAVQRILTLQVLILTFQKGEQTPNNQEVGDRGGGGGGEWWRLICLFEKNINILHFFQRFNNWLTVYTSN